MKNEFLKLAAIAAKIVVPNFYPNYRYYIYITDHQNKSCYALYSRKKGNHYNVFGTHDIYLHDAITGEYIGWFNAGFKVPHTKERLLKADLIELQKIHNNAKVKAVA